METSNTLEKELLKLVRHYRKQGSPVRDTLVVDTLVAYSPLFGWQVWELCKDPGQYSMIMSKLKNEYDIVAHCVTHKTYVQKAFMSLKML